LNGLGGRSENDNLYVKATAVYSDGEEEETKDKSEEAGEEKKKEKSGDSLEESHWHNKQKYVYKDLMGLMDEFFSSSN
jgi:hypothetical protein